MQGSLRVSCITKDASSGVGWIGYGGRSSKSDSHRFALLAAQLYVDRGQRSLMASCVNVLGRNRHVCVRMPKYKDTRKSRQSPIFNGWCDESEPRSPLSELFAKLVPSLQRLKRQRGALRYPPRPPFPEMPTLPDTKRVFQLPSLAEGGSTTSAGGAGEIGSGGGSNRAQLSDSSCSERSVEAVSAADVIQLCTAAKFKLGVVAKPAPYLRRR